MTMHLNKSIELRRINGELKICAVNSDGGIYDYISTNYSVSIEHYDKLRYIVHSSATGNLFFYKNSLKKSKDPRPNTHKEGWVLENGVKLRHYTKKGDVIDSYDAEYCRLRGIDFINMMKNKVK